MSHERTTELFLAACDLPEDERAAFVRSRAAGDEHLAREVLAMLEHDDPDAVDQSPPLALPPLGLPPGLPAGGTLEEHSLPHEVGEYRVLGVLGSGGMGIVVRARQANPEREVALKLLRPGPDAAGLAPRLEREAGLLGRLTHPGIARIYESGVVDTPDGPRPFFAMELVDGRPITEHCDVEGLDARARLELVAKVCDAVQHAHERGVVHRDLKPANVLVDATGAPRVLDFGVARAIEGGPDARLTLDGSFVGTLSSMAPEQVSRGGDQVDARCDVYALGALAYELLAHRAPLEVAGLSLAAAARRIAVDEPTPLGAIDRSHAGDVETIVSKALAKEPARRYRSAAALREDLERWMRHEPVEARPPSAVYRFGRFARRNRGLVASLAVLVLAAVVVAAVSLRAAATSNRERARTERALGRATAVRELLRGAIEGADPFADPFAGASESIATLEGMLDEFARRLDREPVDDAAVEIETRLALARSYKGCSRYETAKAQLDAASARLGELAGDERELADSVRAESALVLGWLGQWEDAAAGLALLAEEFETGGVPARRRATVLGDLLWAMRRTGQFEQAERISLDALELARTIEPPDEGLLAALTTNRGAILSKLERLEEARACYARALELLEGLHPWAHPTVATAANNLGWIEYLLGNLEEADRQLRDSVARFRAAYPGPHALRADYESNLALVLRKRGDIEGAVEMLASALESYRATIGEGHPEALNPLYGMGLLLSSLERWEEAADALARYAGHMREAGEEGRARSAELDRASGLAHVPERRDEAEAALLELFAQVEAAGDGTAVEAAKLREALAELYELAGRLDEAARWRE